MTEKISTFLEANKGYIVELQREMTSRPAIGPDNGGQGEGEKTTYLETELKKLGCTNIQHIDAPDPRVPSGQRPNVAARFPGKSEKTLWVIGHTDVVPPGDPALWDGDPYTLREEGDVIIGRGVEDNQQAIASAMLAAKAVKELGLPINYSLGVMLAADEETHSFYGLEHIVSVRPDLLRPEDLILIPDSGDAKGETIEIAEKGNLALKFTVYGRQCHASTPGNGINSLVAASACVLALDKLYQMFPQKNATFAPDHCTFVPSKKEANVENINTVPGRDVFYMDSRILPGVSLDEVIAAATALAQEAAAAYGAAVEVEVVHRENPAPATSAEAPVVLALKKSLKKLRNLEAVTVGIGGLTVAAILRRRNIPAVVWGTLFKNPHTPNERASVNNAVADAAVILDMLIS